MLRPDGSIHPDGQPVRMERDNDFLPNAAILALASYSGTAEGVAGRLEPYRAWQLRRFRLLHRWGQAGWIPQACAEVFRATNDPIYATSAFEVADWCLNWQATATGAFLTDLSPDGPSFHTAFIAEAVADAWELALAFNDAVRLFGGRSTASNAGRTNGSNRRSTCRRRVNVSLSESKKNEPVLARGCGRLAFEFESDMDSGSNAERTAPANELFGKLFLEFQSEIDQPFLVPINFPEIRPGRDAPNLISNPMREK